MTDYPSFSEQSKNLAKFSWDVVQHLIKNGVESLPVSEEIYNQRMNICNSCSSYDASQQRCKECGCFLPVKAKTIFDGCPLKKWGSAEEFWNENFNDITSEIKPKES